MRTWRHYKATVAWLVGLQIRQPYIHPYYKIKIIQICGLLFYFLPSFFLRLRKKNSNRPAAKGMLLVFAPYYWQVVTNSLVFVCQSDMFLEVCIIYLITQRLLSHCIIYKAVIIEAPSVHAQSNLLDCDYLSIPKTSTFICDNIMYRL